MDKEIEKEVIIERPVNNIVIETAQDDIKNAGIVIDEPKMQESKPEKEAKEEAPKEEKPQKKSRAQRKIERQNQEIRDLKQENEKLAKQESKPKKVKEEVSEPNAEDFETYEEYEEALASHKKQAVVEEPEKDKPQPKEDKRIANMREDGAEDYEDFNEKVSDPQLPLTQTMLNEALDTESPQDIVYYLASNKDITKKIASMSEDKQKREILKIEVLLEQKEKEPKKEDKVRVSKAPEPINPLNGGTETVRTPETAESYSEYENLRAKQNRSSW